jgi:hypothetical protein
MLKVIFISLALTLTPLSAASTTMTQQEATSPFSLRLREAFETGLWGTLIGGALGLAGSGLTKQPLKNLGYIVTGASLGFISGTVYGVAVIFEPSLSVTSNSYDFSGLGAQPQTLAANFSLTLPF